MPLLAKPLGESDSFPLGLGRTVSEFPSNMRSSTPTTPIPQVKPELTRSQSDLPAANAADRLRRARKTASMLWPSTSQTSEYVIGIMGLDDADSCPLRLSHLLVDTIVRQFTLCQRPRKHITPTCTIDKCSMIGEIHGTLYPIYLNHIADSPCQGPPDSLPAQWPTCLDHIRGLVICSQVTDLLSVARIIKVLRLVLAQDIPFVLADFHANDTSQSLLVQASCHLHDRLNTATPPGIRSLAAVEPTRDTAHLLATVASFFEGRFVSIPYQETEGGRPTLNHRDTIGLFNHILTLMDQQVSPTHPLTVNHSSPPDSPSAYLSIVPTTTNSFVTAPVVTLPNMSVFALPDSFSAGSSCSPDSLVQQLAASTSAFSQVDQTEGTAAENKPHHYTTTARSPLSGKPWSASLDTVASDASALPSPVPPTTPLPIPNTPSMPHARDLPPHLKPAQMFNPSDFPRPRTVGDLGVQFPLAFISQRAVDQPMTEYRAWIAANRPESEQQPQRPVDPACDWDLSHVPTYLRPFLCQTKVTPMGTLLTVDSLVDRLIAPHSYRDLRFANTFLLTYQRFLTPGELFVELLQRILDARSTPNAPLLRLIQLPTPWPLYSSSAFRTGVAASDDLRPLLHAFILDPSMVTKYKLSCRKLMEVLYQDSPHLRDQSNPLSFQALIENMREESRSRCASTAAPSVDSVTEASETVSARSSREVFLSFEDFKYTTSNNSSPTTVGPEDSSVGGGQIRSTSQPESKSEAFLPSRTPVFGSRSAFDCFDRPVVDLQSESPITSPILPDAPTFAPLISRTRSRFNLSRFSMVRGGPAGSPLPSPTTSARPSVAESVTPSVKQREKTLAMTMDKLTRSFQGAKKVGSSLAVRRGQTSVYLTVNPVATNSATNFQPDLLPASLSASCHSISHAQLGLTPTATSAAFYSQTSDNLFSPNAAVDSGCIIPVPRDSVHVNAEADVNPEESEEEEDGSEEYASCRDYLHRPSKDTIMSDWTDLGDELIGVDLEGNVNGTLTDWGEPVKPNKSLRLMQFSLSRRRKSSVNRGPSGAQTPTTPSTIAEFWSRLGRKSSTTPGGALLSKSSSSCSEVTTPRELPRELFSDADDTDQCSELSSVVGADDSRQALGSGSSRGLASLTKTLRLKNLSMSMGRPSFSDGQRRKDSSESIRRNTPYYPTQPISFPLPPLTPTSSLSDVVEQKIRILRNYPPNDKVQVDAKCAAQQLTCAEIQLFVDIKPRDLLRYFWKRSVPLVDGSASVNLSLSKNGSESVPYISKRGTKQDAFGTLAPGFEHFNYVADWVTSKILSNVQVHQRVKVIMYFLDVAAELLALNNFNTLMAVMAGLNSNAIYRLHRTRAILQENTEYNALWKRLDALTSSERSYRAYRERLLASPLPCIPFLGCCLRDLVFVDESLPENNRDQLKGGISAPGSAKSSPTSTVVPALFWRKFEFVGDIILMLRKQQRCFTNEEFPQHQSIQSNPTVIQLIMGQPCLDENEAHELSLHLEPRTVNVPR